MMSPRLDVLREPSRATVDVFLSNLSLRYLLHILRRLPKIPFSGLDDLPAELVCNIASRLQLVDFYRCLHVSRAWRMAWTHGAVISWISRKFFPGLLETHSNPFDFHEVFQETLDKRVRRHLGLPATVAIPWDTSCSTGALSNNQDSHLDSTGKPGREDSTPEWTHGRVMCYGDGKMAWQQDSSQVIVEDFRTWRRLKCIISSVPFNNTLRVEAVSEKMLVFLEYSTTNAIFGMYVSLEPKHDRTDKLT